MRKIKILCDGNCFFRAVSHQLFNHENNHSELRSVAIKYISKNEFLFQSFISDEDKILHDYILHMSKLNTYADQLVITGTTMILNQNIVVRELGKFPLLIPILDYIDHQLHILYNPNIQHSTL